MARSISQLRRARLSTVQSEARAAGLSIFGENPTMPLDKGRLIDRIARHRKGQTQGDERQVYAPLKGTHEFVDAGPEEGCGLCGYGPNHPRHRVS